MILKEEISSFDQLTSLSFIRTKKKDINFQQNLVSKISNFWKDRAEIENQPFFEVWVILGIILENLREENSSKCEPFDVWQNIVSVVCKDNRDTCDVILRHLLRSLHFS